MIYSIAADKASFHPIIFKPGFNVVLAQRTKESTKKDSRNGLGKSTLIEIIHFCLGGNKGETLSKPELEGWTFTIELDIEGKRTKISRNTSRTVHSKIAVEGDFADWQIKPSYDKKAGSQVLSKKDWNNLLGKFVFDLPIFEEDIKYQPSFRSLFSFFVRKNGHSGAFLNPFQQYSKQHEWDIQVNNAFLLGLDWVYPSKLQVLKDRKKVLDQIRTEAHSGILSSLIGSIGELEARMVRLDAQAKQESEQLDSFKVHPQYARIETEVNEITRRLHQLSNEDIENKNLLSHYENSLTDEVDANPETIRNVYEEAGLHFPDQITQRIDDVLAFHKKVVINRQDFLRAEINRLKRDITFRDGIKTKLGTKRAELMNILKTHGALEEYTQLQNLHQQTVSELQNIKLKIENLKRFEQGKSALAIDTELLFQEAKIEISQRQKQKEKAILFFNENSKALYDAPGTLSVDIEKTGYKFGVNIERSGSHGIGNMKIFCYDLMLAQLWAEKQTTPILLVHDSIIFADVDERQIAHALELAAKEASRLGFQYICTLNSDSTPANDFSSNFSLENFVRASFTDSTEDGGLLGIRF
jgi:uncharacterized protein YydD (DUF2326 family)